MHERIPTRFRGRGAAWLLAGLLAGCAVRPAAEAPPAPPSSCAAWFAAAELAVDDAGVRDVQSARVPGRPHLRVDRLLAALARTSPRGDAYASWLGHAAERAAEGWHAELTNLPSEARDALAGGGDSLQARTRDCIAEGLARDRREPGAREALLAAARVPDAYLDWQRVVGLYPLTRLAVLAGYYGWRDRLDAAYARPLDALPVEGRLERYAAPRAGVSGTVQGWTRDALGYPVLDDAGRDALFARHSPLWEIDTRDRDDLPGRPEWSGDDDRPAVDTRRPTVYRHLSYTRVAGSILPQLNYLVWFPARPPEHDGDIYAGHLDGLLLRVTLDEEGRPLLYDAIHPCGCYHMFFPGPRLRPRPHEAVGGEGYHVPQRAPEVGPGERLAVRVSAGTHQLLRLHAVPMETPVTPLAVRDYDALRSLAHPPGRRSLFGPVHGLVPGTERSERFLLWPMGIPSAGAMRQWGQHATAFVGRRHFDDPGLVEAGFELLPARN